MITIIMEVTSTSTCSNTEGLIEQKEIKLIK